MCPDGPDPVLPVIERYYDAVPRTVARVEYIGPFTLFITGGPGWSYYARPSLGTRHVTAADVQRVRVRQRDLGLPESFEWVAETTPRLRAAIEEAGLAVAAYPLLICGTRPSLPHPDSVEIRMATGEDDLALLNAIASVGFAAPGTAVGPAGVSDAAALAADGDPTQTAFQRERLQSGCTVMALAAVGDRPVAVGSHQPVGAVSEIVGVAVLPAFRRRGIAAALTGVLVDDAVRRGIDTVFLSAGDGAIARVYQRIGFRRIATACAANLPLPAEGRGAR